VPCTWHAACTTGEDHSRGKNTLTPILAYTALAARRARRLVASLDHAARRARV